MRERNNEGALEKSNLCHGLPDSQTGSPAVIAFLHCSYYKDFPSLFPSHNLMASECPTQILYLKERGRIDSIVSNEQSPQKGEVRRKKNTSMNWF